MEDFPKVKKSLENLPKVDRLRERTLQLIAGAFMTAGIFLGPVVQPTEVKSEVMPEISQSRSGKVITLAPSPLQYSQNKGNSKTFGHYSHQSHSSHSSHHSHHSHYSSR